MHAESMEADLTSRSGFGCIDKGDDIVCAVAQMVPARAIGRRKLDADK